MCQKQGNLYFVHFAKKVNIQSYRRNKFEKFLANIFFNPVVFDASNSPGFCIRSHNHRAGAFSEYSKFNYSGQARIYVVWNQRWP